MIGAPVTVLSTARSWRCCSSPSAHIVRVERGTRRYVGAWPSVYSGTVKRSSFSAVVIDTSVIDTSVIDTSLALERPQVCHRATELATDDRDSLTVVESGRGVR
jgi:hypothetical protein